MIAPSNLYGLNLGSLGLALKMVIIQIIAINVEILYISKSLKFSFSRILKIQIVIILFLVINSYCTLLIGNQLSNNIIVSFILSGFLYTIIAFTYIYLFPSIINSSRTEILQLIQSLYSMIFLRIKR